MPARHEGESTKPTAYAARAQVNETNCLCGTIASYRINLPIGLAIIFAFGEIRLISTVSFRLCGEHLLSLHDESRQRRAKEREDNRSERFSSLSLESYPSFDRTRIASVAKAPVSYVCENVKVIPATLGYLN